MDNHGEQYNRDRGDAGSRDTALKGADLFFYEEAMKNKSIPFFPKDQRALTSLFPLFKTYYEYAQFVFG